MKTTELFEFRFVDREDEQKKLNAFLSQYNDNALWIRGNSGFGKTKFFHYVLDRHKEYNLCYIDIKNIYDGYAVQNRRQEKLFAFLARMEYDDTKWTR